MSDVAPTISIPRLTTERLCLREPRVGDFDAYVATMEDPDASAWLRKLPDRRAMWRAFSAMSGAWMLTGTGWWAITLREDDTCVGLVGAFFREDLLCDLETADVELGWMMFRPYWRRGFATEAARAALASAFERLPSRRAIAVVQPENVASVRVCQAIGMRPDAELQFEDVQLTRFAVDRPA
jgi:RimJ/RimL family protein N-acetyltransferase